jgi:hypothetical protein
MQRKLICVFACVTVVDGLTEILKGGYKNFHFFN